MSVHTRQSSRTTSQGGALKRWVIVIALIIVVFGAIFGGKAYMNHRAALVAEHQHFPPATVSTALAKSASWHPNISALATVAAISGTEITAEIAGDVTKVAFSSGSVVKRGTLLVQIDDSTELAKLHADQAKLELAKTNVVRARKLFAAHATSQANLQTAEADIATARAAIEGDQAVLAKLRVTAPFDGTLGIRQVSLGQYVSPGTPIVDLQSYSPIYLNFSLPQSHIGALKTGEEVRFTTGAYPGETFTGRVTSIGSRIDPATRNINLQATFANASDRLRPGIFGSATLDIGQPLHGLAVPSTAIAYSTFGDTVYVVKKSDHGKAMTVHAAIVRVLEQRGASTLIAHGIAPGALVVTAGQNKLRDGAPVMINNKIHP